ncbi:DMT family transporter [Sphingomonas ginsenosidimutans]|jgi:drug/metabolite transporter (DMT)-like permease|uniref:EamA family transporter n=1 Tax=Sphingomonas ginsenosidimutans TaxID=862134 RepID=A0A2A4I1N3_9SPHN|nr:DMT family transporter [Sphingomonas ginsenosidimutans]PCG10181.1 EamA family transporter [Sphingomonas ginsenosidimutans]
MSSDRILAGIALRLLAIFFLATMSALIKWGEHRGATLFEGMFWRQACALPVVLAFVVRGPGLASLRTARFRGHLARAMVGLVGMVFTFGAVILLPLAEATTFQFTVPIFATILGATLLKERTGIQRWAAVLVGFVGVLVVAQPGSAHLSPMGAAVGLLAALFVALVAVLLRQLRDEPTGTTVFWFTTLTLPPIAIPYAFHLQAHDAGTWAILAATGVVGALGQLSITAASRLAPVSAVVPMDYSGLLWATIYGWLLFGALPAPMTWVGAPIIIASGLFIVWREHRLGRQQTTTVAPDD